MNFLPSNINKKIYILKHQAEEIVFNTFFPSKRKLVFWIYGNCVDFIDIIQNNVCNKQCIKEYVLPVARHRAIKIVVALNSFNKRIEKRI